MMTRPARPEVWWPDLHGLKCDDHTCTAWSVMTRTALPEVWWPELHCLKCDDQTCTAWSVMTRTARPEVWWPHLHGLKCDDQNCTAWSVMTRTARHFRNVGVEGISIVGGCWSVSWYLDTFCGFEGVRPANIFCWQVLIVHDNYCCCLCCLCPMGAAELITTLNNCW